MSEEFEKQENAIEIVRKNELEPAGNDEPPKLPKGKKKPEDILSLAFCAVFALSIVVLLFNVLRMLILSKSLQNTSDMESFDVLMGKLGSLLRVLGTIGNAHAFICFMIAIGIGITVFTLYNRKKQGLLNETFKTLGFLTLAGSIVLGTVASALISPQISAIKAAANMDFDSMGLVAGQMTASPIWGYLAGLFYFGALALSAAHIIVNFLGINKVDNMQQAVASINVENINKQGEEFAKAASEMGAQAAAFGSASIEKATQVVNSIDKEEVKQKVQKNKKPIIIAICVVAAIIILIGGFKIVKEVLTPEAVVSVADMSVDVRFTGFDGEAKAEAMVSGYPMVTEVKHPERTGEIQKIVQDYEIKLSKEDNIKNGDEVVATVTFKEPKGIKLKYDKTQLENKATAKDLEEFVKKYKEIKNHADRLETDAKKKIVGSYRFSDSKNLKIEKIAMYERPLTKDTIESEKLRGGSMLSNYYELYIVYKVSGDRVPFFSDELEHFENYAYVSFGYFKKKGKALAYDVKNVYTYDDAESIENIDNELILDGLEKIK